MEENSPHKIYGAIRIIYRPNFLGLWNICNNFWLKQKYIVVKGLIFNHATEVHHTTRHLAFLWKPIHCAQVNFIKNLEEEWLLGNAFYVILQKRNRHFLAEYEAFKQEILHLQNILQNLKILFCQQFCNSENSDNCVGLIHSAILHLKNDISFWKNNPTQKPQPYRELSYKKAGEAK